MVRNILQNIVKVQLMDLRIICCLMLPKKLEFMLLEVYFLDAFICAQVHFDSVYCEESFLVNFFAFGL